MKKFELDGTHWKSTADFYDALADALGSFAGHGRNPDAFEETMIYHLELNDAQPPYEVVIRNAPEELQPFLRRFASRIAEARGDRRDDPDGERMLRLGLPWLSPGVRIGGKANMPSIHSRKATP